MYSIVMLTALSAGADVTPPPAAVAAPVVGLGGNGVVLTGYTGSCYGLSYQGRHHGSFYGIYPHTYFTSLGYSLAGTCHGGALVIYGPVGVPPATPYGFHTGLAPVWGAGPPVVFGRLVDSPVVPGSTDSPNKPPEMTIPVPPMTRPGSDTSPMGANLKFQVPADAKLYVGGKLASGTGPERAFITPPLPVGQKFYYEVKVELVVGGKTITEERTVVVEAGADLTAAFPMLIAAVAKPGRVAGR